MEHADKHRYQKLTSNLQRKELSDAEAALYKHALMAVDQE